MWIKGQIRWASSQLRDISYTDGKRHHTLQSPTANTTKDNGESELSGF